MSGDWEDGASEEEERPGGPVYTPPGQSILPGFKGDISQRPVDYRQWTDGHGNKIDSPRYKGRTSSGGKTIPEPSAPGGEPLRLGSLQVLRDARGAFVVVDWKKTMFASDEPAPRAPGDPDPDGPGSTPRTPLMGRVVYRTQKDLSWATGAMRAIHRDALDRAAGLPEDPAPTFDLAGTRIAIGKLSLRRFERWKKYLGRYAVVDESVPVGGDGRIFLLKDKTLKAATSAFVALAHKRQASAPKSRRFVGAPIAFSAPVSFGSSWVPDWERDLPQPGSPSWDAVVARYAQTGRWCASAFFPTGRPPALVEEAMAAREAFLKEAPLEVPASDPAALRTLRSLPRADKKAVASVLDFFDATLVSLTPSGRGPKP